MTVQELIDSGLFSVLVAGEKTDRRIEKVFCCDMLSVAMGKGPERAAWVTVMGNMNTIAVAMLAEMSCIILAEGAQMDEAGLEKAKEQKVTLLASDEPIFETALKIADLMK